MKGMAFLDFEDRSAASFAYQHLQGLVSGPNARPLVIEYATPHSKRSHQPLPTQDILSLDPAASVKDPLKKENVPESIAPSLGLHYPSNPHLRYRYPDPTPDTLSNMLHAIATIPRLYVQVLHLMNKMNLPPPFRPVDRDSVPSLLKRKQDDLLADDESELESQESSEDEVSKQSIKRRKIRQVQMAVQEQKKALQRTETKVFNEPVIEEKQVNRFKIVLHSEEAKAIQTDVSEETAAIPTDEEEKMAAISTHVSEETAMIPVDTSEDTAERDVIRIAETELFSLAYIESNRMPLQNLENLPAFKNHSPGNPSNKLFIKNLSKQVQVKDLERLFGRFLLDSNNYFTPTDLTIQLMKTGRLKGQAFITFPTPQKAQTALESTHGFILCDKPIAVKFSKSSA
ncbi:hypothetical protein BDF14DRAFT_1771705 [Spinellus fusiger]|nr:hypothetical protein BDF14DRAFT_1771705 [Spinellus fusiger]